MTESPLLLEDLLKPGKLAKFGSDGNTRLHTTLSSGLLPH